MLSPTGVKFFKDTVPVPNGTAKFLSGNRPIIQSFFAREVKTIILVSHNKFKRLEKNANCNYKYEKILLKQYREKVVSVTTFPFCYTDQLSFQPILYCKPPSPQTAQYRTPCNSWLVAWVVAYPMLGNRTPPSPVPHAALLILELQDLVGSFG